MIVFTPNTVIKSADVNLNFDELKTKTDYLSAPDSTWIAPTFTNSWVNYDLVYNQCGYYKDALGFVHLRGLVKNGSDGTSIFTLPSGYRPQYQELMAVSSADHYGRVDVATTGTVVPSATTTEPTWVSLDGIIFKAYA